MLSMPILNGRIGKWILALLEFDLRYESTKAVKGQAIADFITHHREGEVTLLELTHWGLFFDGSTCKQGGGVGIVLISPQGISFEYDIPIKLTSTNIQGEYEAILKGYQLLQGVKAESIEVFGDSQLVIYQLLSLYECKDDVLKKYYEECRELLNSFSFVIIKHIPRNQNQDANRLAQSASGYRQIVEILADEFIANED